MKRVNFMEKQLKEKEDLIIELKNQLKKSIELLEK
jgi:hypothetical protein